MRIRLQLRRFTLLFYVVGSGYSFLYVLLSRACVGMASCIATITTFPAAGARSTVGEDDETYTAHS